MGIKGLMRFLVDNAPGAIIEQKQENYNGRSTPLSFPVPSHL